MTTGTYGLVAQFDDPASLVVAARRAFEAGYRRMDAYSPFPIHGLSEALGQRYTVLPWIVFAGGLLGGIGGYVLQYWTNGIDYPLNIGGRPLHSWVAFIPVAFECTVLAAALTTVLGLFVLNGLPRPHHPVFGAPGFERASIDAFYLCIKALDPKFEHDETRAFLQELSPRVVAEIQS